MTSSGRGPPLAGMGRERGDGIAVLTHDIEELNGGASESEYAGDSHKGSAFASSRPEAYRRNREKYRCSRQNKGCREFPGLTSDRTA
jgi:hypothetical protein